MKDGLFLKAITATPFLQMTGRTMDSQGMSKTSVALRNLRGAVIILIVAFHSFSAYIVSQPASPPPFDDPPYAWRGFPIISNERWIGFDLLCAFLFLYLMQLMFFLSGLFVWPSLTRRGWGTFLIRRILRLGLPFVVGTYLLMPLAFYAAYRVRAVDPGWPAFWSHWTALPISPAGPLWFLWFLLVLDAGAAALFQFRSRLYSLSLVVRKTVADPVRFFIVLMFGSAAVYFPLAAIYSPWQYVGYGPFEIQAAGAPQYALYFAAGVAVGAYGSERGLLEVSGMLARQWHYFVMGSIAAFMVWIGPTALIMKGGAIPTSELRLTADLGLVIFAGAASFGMIGGMLRFGTAHWAIIDQISENAFGIYFFHYPIVVWLQYALLGISLPAIVKALLVLIGALLLSLAASTAANRLIASVKLLINKGRLVHFKPF